MKYMLMMQGTRSGWEAMGSWSPGEIRAHVEFMIRLNEELRRNGELVLAEGLDLPHHAKVVQARQPGTPVVSDGPFAETKEFLAGFWIVDVPSEQRAIEIAAKASTAPGPGGTPLGIPIELRRVGSAPDAGG
jgi:hypothetical protein